MCEGLTVKLQMQAADVIHAYRVVHAVASILKSMREESERVFKRIYAETTKLGKELHGEDFELRQPRVNMRQTHKVTSKPQLQRTTTGSHSITNSSLP